MSREEFAKEQMRKHPELSKKTINTEIPEWVLFGNNCYIAENVIFSPRGFGYIEIDGKCEHIPHSGTVVIGDDVDIMGGTNITRATADSGITHIGDGTKIDYNCHIAHNVKIGKNCLVIAGTIIGGSTEIGDNCYLGIGCMIKNKVKIGNNVTIGMGAVVTKDIPDNETWVGNPARKFR